MRDTHFPEEVVLSTKDLHVHMERTSPLKASTCSLKRIRQPWSVSFRIREQPTSVVWNRMNDTTWYCATGEIWYKELMSDRPDITVYEMRKHIGMVFQRPNPLPNRFIKITFPHERAGVKDKKILDELVETSWKQAVSPGHMTFINQPWHCTTATTLYRTAISVKPDIYLWMSQHQRWSDRDSAIRRNHAELKKDYNDCHRDPQHANKQPV